jgi:hypothetical protein
MSTNQIATPPRKITFRSSMIEDYLQIAISPVAQNAEGKFLVVESVVNSRAIPELITVDRDGKVVNWKQSPASHSGWEKTLVPVPLPAGAAVIALQGFIENNQLTVLVEHKTGAAAPQVMPMLRSASGQWSQTTFPAPVVNVSQLNTYRDPLGKNYVYGLSTDRGTTSLFITSLRSGSANWVSNYYQPAPDPSASYHLLHGTGADQINVLWLKDSQCSFRGGSIVGEAFVWGKAPVVRFSIQQGPEAARDIVSFPAAIGRSDFLMVGTQNDLYYVENYSGGHPITRKLTGPATTQPAGVTEVAVGVDSLGQYIVFALDSVTSRLWLLRQSGIAAGSVQFSDWVRLGNVMSTIGCPSVMNLGPELFAVSEGTIVWMNQSYTQAPAVRATAGTALAQADQRIYANWFLKPVAEPTPSTVAPQRATSYATEIAVLNEFDTPVAGVAMTISTDRLSIVVIDGVSYQLDPYTPAQVVTNSAGKVTVQTTATNLSSPQYNVHVAAFMPHGVTQSHRADFDTHVRLSGQDPLFPVTAASMTQAGLMPPNYPNAADAVAAIAKIGTTMVQKSVPALRPPAPFGIEFDFRSPDAPVVRRMTEDEAVAFANRAFSLGKLFGDVANHIKHDAQALEHVTMAAVDGAIHLGLTVFGEVNNFILDTIEDMSNATEMLLRKINQNLAAVAHVMEKAISWLELIFEWHDILNTKKVVKYYFNSVLNNLSGGATSAITKLRANFAKLRTDVQQGFDNAGNIFSHTVNFNQYANQVANRTDPTLNVLAGARYHTAYAAQTVRCNYISSKSFSYYESLSPAMAALGASSGSVEFQAFLNKVKEMTGNPRFTSALAGFQTFLKNRVHDPQDFFNMLVMLLIEAGKDFTLVVLDLIEEILVLALEMLSSAIAGLHTVLNSTIDIPLVSWLYRHISGESLTIIDLVSLIFAVPATILYKLTIGAGKTPFTDNQVAQILSRPIPWPSAAPLAPSSLDTVLAELGAIAAFCNAPVEMINDGLAFSGGDEIPLAAFLEWTSLGLAYFSLGASVPYHAIATPPSQQSAADKATIALWELAALPVAVSTIFTVFDSLGVAALADEVAEPLASAMGMMLFGAGLATSISQSADRNYSKWGVVGNLIQPVPSMGKVLLMAHEPISFAVLEGLDVVGNVGTTVCLIGGVASQSAVQSVKPQKQQAQKAVLATA